MAHACKIDARCWDSVEECLTADRLERIQQVLNAKKDGARTLLQNFKRCDSQLRSFMTTDLN